MPVPDKLKYLIEALRGGGYTSAGGEHTYGPSAQSSLNPNPQAPPASPQVMPTSMRGYQLYKQEAQVNGEPVMSYRQWLASQ